MTAPKRIMAWVWKLPYPSKHEGRAEWNSVAHPVEQDCTSYTRTDLIQPMIDAAVAARLEEAAGKRFRALVRQNGDTPASPPWLEEFWAVREADILALIPNITQGGNDE